MVHQLISKPSPILDKCDRQTLLDYFENSWELEEILMKSLVRNDSFYLNPDPLRNPIIFYLGHSPVFYINKLIRVGLLEQRINPDYEILFEIGVDPSSPEELKEATKNINWPEVETVWNYRDKAKESIIQVLKTCPLNLPIHQNHPLWALIMATEHNRIHFETSSMLLRQFSVEHLKRPDNWQYAPSNPTVPENKMIQISGGKINLGKPQTSNTYGWDSEYGHRTLEVKPFCASQHLITNGEFLQFVQDNGYENPDFWDRDSWNWKLENNVKHPKFWIPKNESYHYRTIFDKINLPLDWPVEVNHYEAMAYCRWKGEGTRLMTEAEWTIAAANCDDNQDFNLNVKFGSPSPVGSLNHSQSSSGLYDLRGNLWEWLSDNFNPLPGFKPHYLYEDVAAPFFDDRHKMMMGGSWATNGSMASKTYRNWFRPYFYQHAGFRTAHSV